MAFPISPGVEVNEVDLTLTPRSINPSTGAFAGHFRWGPVEKAILIDSEDTLVARFFEPDASSYQSFFTVSNFLAYAGGIYVVRANSASHKNATADGSGLNLKNEDFYEQNYFDGSGAVGEWAARYPSDLGNSLRVSICPSNTAFGGNLVATANTTLGSNLYIFSANVKADAVAPLAEGDLLTVGTQGYLEVVNISSTGVNVTVNAVATATGVANSAARKWRYADLFPSSPRTSDFASDMAGANDEMHVVIVDRTGKFSGEANTVLERFGFLSKASDAVNADGTTNYYKQVIFNKSKYILWMDHLSDGTNWGSTANGTTFTAITRNFYQQLSGGTIGSPSDSNLITAYDKFANPEEIDVSLIATGAASNTVSDHILDNIAEVRRDAIVFISPESADVVETPGAELDNVIEYRERFGSTSFGFMTCNWKYQFDRYGNIYRYVPDNGDIAGLAARVRDPWVSPAGPNKGLIKNIVRLAWNPTKAQRDELYKKGINPVVTFPGEGPQLFGDKTLFSKPSAFDRIGVRRLFSVLEKTIAQAARFSLFEFNDEFTRARFVNLVEPYLRDVQGRRGITDYRVVCDETNNTPFVIDNEQFVGDIYIVPARSINFIQLNFIAAPTGVVFEEIIGRFG